MSFAQIYSPSIESTSNSIKITYDRHEDPKFGRGRMVH